MPNESSPHGGFISEGTVIHGTHREQDLLRAFAAEYERVLPFNSRELVDDARDIANALDTSLPEGLAHWHEVAAETIVALIDALDVIASREGLIFGAHEGDGSDFGYWAIETDEE